MTKSKAKYIQSLSEKKLRDAEGVFIAEGPKLLAELIQYYPDGIKEVYALKEWTEANSGGRLQNASIEIITAEELSRIAFLKTPNQVLAICRKPQWHNILLKDNFTLMLDSIQDPGNLGTIIRCADWFGVSQIICSHDSADAFGPKCVQSSMGSIIRVKIEYGDLQSKLMEERSVSVYAATLDGSDVAEVGSVPEAVLLIGNESKGLKPELVRLANHRITIPRVGKAESLNAGVATGILLSHLTSGSFTRRR